MSNEHLPDEFDFFIDDCQHAADAPATLAELAARNRIPTPAELCQERIRSFQQAPEPDPFTRLLEAEAAVAQQRITQEIQRPVQIKKAATATEPTFEGEAKAEPGDLAFLLLGSGVEGDEPPPAIVGTLPSSGRAREPERSFAKVGGGSRGSFLNQPFDTVLEMVGERTAGGARELARAMAAQWREGGGL